MSNSDNKEEEQEPKVVIGWSSTLKKTEYDVRELSALRKPATPSGTGYLYFNPTTNNYERYRSIDFLPSSRNKRQQQKQQEQQ
jgi:hypothetical protein